MYFSTYHWLPLVNGYSAYPPPPYDDVMAAARRLPDPAALREVLERTHPRWVVVHRRDVPLLSRSAYEAPLRAVLTPVADFGDDVLFEVH